MGTILTGVLVVVVLAAILLCGIRKRRKGGCGGCPCSCSCSCGGSCSGAKPGKNNVSNETPRR